MLDTRQPLPFRAVGKSFQRDDDAIQHIPRHLHLQPMLLVYNRHTLRILATKTFIFYLSNQEEGKAAANISIKYLIRNGHYLKGNQMEFNAGTDLSSGQSYLKQQRFRYPIHLFREILMSDSICQIYIFVQEYIYHPNALIKLTVPCCIQQRALKKKLLADSYYYECRASIAVYANPPGKLHPKWTFYDKITHLYQNQNKQKTPLREFKYFSDHYCRNTETQQISDMQESALYREELTNQTQYNFNNWIESRLLIKPKYILLKATISYKGKMISYPWSIKKTHLFTFSMD